ACGDRALAPRHQARKPRDLGAAGGGIALVGNIEGERAFADLDALHVRERGERGLIADVEPRIRPGRRRRDEQKKRRGGFDGATGSHDVQTFWRTPSWSPVSI